jgi:hypothetical protein
MHEVVATAKITIMEWVVEEENGNIIMLILIQLKTCRMELIRILLLHRLSLKTHSTIQRYLLHHLGILVDIIVVDLALPLVELELCNLPWWTWEEEDLGAQVEAVKEWF